MTDPLRPRWPVLAVAGLLCGGQAASGAPLAIDLPAQSLGTSIMQLAQTAGLSVSVDAALVDGRQAPAVNGMMEPERALQQLLEGSGLQLIPAGTGTYTIQPIPTTVEGDAQALGAITVEGVQPGIDIGPTRGLRLRTEELPYNVQSVSAEEIKASKAVSLTDLLNRKLQSVNVNDYQGNPFQMDVQYRGFTAGPQIGTPQGLAVFFDGIRVNEPFGDVVNWDLIPMNAIASVDVFPGSNPLFGLGTLGGAFTVRTKSGFDAEGTDVELLAGSFGRKQLQVEKGWNNGVIGLFGAANLFMEDGWRSNSPSDVNQIFGKASYRGEKLELDLSTMYVWNDLVGNGLVPSQMYEQDPTSVFTSPDTTKNRLLQFQLAGTYNVSDTFSVTGQVYRRDTQRHSVGADVFTEFEGIGNLINRNLNPGEDFTCLFNSTNQYGLPDYYIYEIPDPNDWSTSPFLFNYLASGTVDLSLLPADAFNQPLPADFAAHATAEFNFWKNPRQSLFYVPTGEDIINPPPFGEVTSYSNGEPSYLFNGPAVIPTFSSAPPGATLDPLAGLVGFYYYTPDGAKHMFTPIAAFNRDNCLATQSSNPIAGGDAYLGVLDPKTGAPQVADGFGTEQTGVVDGTPTAVLTNNEIEQITEGASVQLNWNLEEHKFMIGASIDRPSAIYGNGQRLGLMDSKRNAYLAPNEIRDQYAAADIEVRNNDFSGFSATKSAYVSETWSPLRSLHLSGSLRFNETHGKNTLAVRNKGDSAINLAYIGNQPSTWDVCRNGVCPTTGYKTPDLSNLIEAPETEKSKYFSLNPSLGVSWEATDSLDVYGNWARGTRTPSVIELGCAFDDTLVDAGPRTDENGNEIGRQLLERSLAENRSCQLPTVLSGDPFLPQIKAETFDFGLRGKLGTWAEWNLGAYRTNLSDDLYYITYPGNRNFFDTIGNTRRQGIEAGISATISRWSVALNYALSDATFQSTFDMASNDNSSAVLKPDYCNPETGACAFSEENVGIITVNPGDRMPGVPLHNLNASIGYEVNDKWSIGLSAVAHSGSFVRGNENNDHQPGVVRFETVNRYLVDGAGNFLGIEPVQAARQPTSNPGTVGGYVVFNLQTSYAFSPDVILGLQVNNLFDKDYFSAGRLGRNPFSPSINGAIGPDGYNHNSGDWLSTNFLAPGAPRAAWLTLNLKF
jgi:Fe(3+) dicitrate transport protein